MTSDRLRELDERIAEPFRDDTPISTYAEPPLATSVDPPTIEEAVFEARIIEDWRTPEEMQRLWQINRDRCWTA